MTRRKTRVGYYGIKVLKLWFIDPFRPRWPSGGNAECVNPPGRSRDDGPRIASLEPERWSHEEAEISWPPRPPGGGGYYFIYQVVVAPLSTLGKIIMRREERKKNRQPDTFFKMITHAGSQERNMSHECINQKGSEWSERVWVSERECEWVRELLENKWQSELEVDQKLEVSGSGYRLTVEGNQPGGCVCVCECVCVCVWWVTFVLLAQYFPRVKDDVCDTSTSACFSQTTTLSKAVLFIHLSFAR